MKAISLRLERQGKKAKIAVENNVDGMEPQVLSNMFERFFRADATRGKQSGYGIGLSIAKAIVDLHKGKITAAVSNETTLVITVLLPS